MRAVVVLLLALACGPAFATSLDRSVAQLHHTAWTAKDGAPSQITALAQTADGYLWIGTARGLFHYDGVSFERYAPPAGVSLPGHSIYALLATRDGGLWISFRPAGMAFLKGHSLTVFTRPEELPSAQVYELAADLDGRVWAASHNGLELRDGSRWVRAGDESNAPPGRAWHVYVDRQGTLWAVVDRTVVFLRRGARRFERTTVDGMTRWIGQARDGTIWISEMVGGAFRPLDGKPRGGIPAVQVQRFHFDRDGVLWGMGYELGGVVRVRVRGGAPAAVETYTIEDGLSGLAPRVFLEDREGNMWMGTEKGLDRFRSSPFVPVALPPHLFSLTLFPGRQDELYVASASVPAVVRTRGEEVVTGTTPVSTSSVCRAANGDVWWGGQGGIYRQRGESYALFPQPRELGQHDWMWEVICDSQHGGLWVSVGDLGLVHVKDGVWSRDVPRPPGLLERGPSATFRDPRGRTWFGYTENRAALLDGGRARLYTSADGIDVGRIRVIRGRGAHVWFGGELGLALFRDGRFRSVLAATGEPFGTVTGIIETADGSVWLNEMRGILRLPPEEVRRVLEDPSHRVRPQVFDFLDGLRGSPQMSSTVSTATETTDGRLWFATDNGLVWTDPRRISLNKVPPSVIIQTLEADRPYPAAPGIVLPPGTQRAHFRYTATSLRIPERVAFRYKLEGIDDGWQDAGPRREAFYNRLTPGEYTFRVIASNDDGIWNEQGAALRFRVQPAWYQTQAFRVACVLLLLLAIWALHRLRVRQVEAAAGARFDERLAERTRLAREMHDTLLQTIQGSKMVADDALENAGDPARMQSAVRQLSAWLDRAVVEGRAALHSLRSSTTETNDLLEALQHAIETIPIPSSMSVTVTATGDRRKEMHPIVRDELYHLAHEAIVNGAAHARASHLRVELGYGPDFTLRVEDDGAGIPPDLLERGKPGHFGLQGMRERAARIEAHLTIASSAESGTAITVVVPGGIAYRKEHGRVGHP